MSVMRVDTTDPAVREKYNKCDECCDVVGCAVCGPCEVHDETEDNDG